MACEVCDGKLKGLLYENDKIKIFLAAKPLAEGHVQIFPKEHHTIIETLPDNLLEYMSFAANRMSMLLFEIMKSHGTNIVVQNGIPAGQTIPHFSIHIIPRRTDDGLKLDWDMKQAPSESLDNMQRIISEGMNMPEPAKSAVIDITPEKVATIEKPKEKGKVNYFLKSLERVP